MVEALTEAKRGGCELCLVVVLDTEFYIQGALVITGSSCTGATGLVGKHHRNAPFRQVAGQSGTGDPGANDDDGVSSDSGGSDLFRRWQSAGQHFPLAPEAGNFRHLKAFICQRTTNPADRGEGGQGGAGLAVSPNLMNGFFKPHVRVQRRRKSIKEPGVGHEFQFVPGVQYIAKTEGKPDSAAAKYQAVRSFDQRWVVLNQLPSQGLQPRPALQGLFQIGQRQGVTFHRDEVKNCVAFIVRSLSQPLGPGRQEVEPGSETCLGDHKVAVPVEFREAPG